MSLLMKHLIAKKYMRENILGPDLLMITKKNVLILIVIPFLKKF